MRATNERVMQEIKDGKYFKYKFTNFIGNFVVEYLVRGSYEFLVNPDPVNLDANTLEKNMDYYSVVENFVDKPLDKIEHKDMMRFIEAYRNGKIKSSLTGEPLTMPQLRRYVGTFKKFWKVYRQYELKRLGKKFDQTKFEWGIEFKSPKVEKEYEDYPYLTLPQLLDIANNMCKEEYRVRLIVALNLMGRKCELTALRMRNVSFRDDNSVWIKLPKIKKHSSKKVDVELYSYAKEPFMAYIKKHDFNADDLVFPSKQEAFNKNLREVSKKILKTDTITSKTLRKLGVCVAEQIGITRPDVERVGGWSANSKVLEHYFNRKGVPAKSMANTKIDREVNKNAYIELDKMKVKLDQKDKESEEMKKTIERMEKKNEEHLKHMQLMLEAVKNPLTEGDIDVKGLLEDEDKYRKFLKFRRKMKEEGLINE